MINIVIPMAGAGSRFSVAGFDLPKPFISFNNKMMIEHVLGSFNNVNANFILVLQEKFLSEQKKQIDYLKNRYTLTFATVPKLTMGAAITALASYKLVDSNQDIIFADSDNIFNPCDIKDFIEYVRRNKLDGALLTFKSDRNCYSYAKTNAKGELIETKEKEVISRHAICGAYYFKSVELFKEAVIDLIIESDLSKGEFYMSNVYNHLKKTTNKIGIFDINKFDCVGTPEQLREYIERNSIERI